MKNASMIETAYAILARSGEAIKFADLWNEVKAELEIGDDEEAARIGHFYTDLSLDGRFVALPNNFWDLRTRTTYDKVHIDIADVYSDVNESDDDEEDKAENKEYDESVQGAIAHDEEEANPEDDGSESKAKEAEDIENIKKSFGE